MLHTSLEGIVVVSRPGLAPPVERTMHHVLMERLASEAGVMPFFVR